MGIFNWIKKKLTPEPDVIYVRAPNPVLTEAEKREIAAMEDGADQLSETLKKLHEKSERLKQETARSIRGIK